MQAIRPNLVRGFTLVEVMVTVAIVTILMSTAIVNYYSFNDKLSLSSAGQEMAINIRLSQSYGLNVKEVSVGSGNFSVPYGVYFDIYSGSIDNYTIFSDIDGDKRYDEGSGCGQPGSECVEKVFLRNGVLISFVDAVSTCPATNAARSLTLRFIRPNPDADINFLTNGQGSVVCSSLSNAIITLTSKGGRTMIVTVEKTGQISVQ